jgi:hypothetical protein
MVEEETKSLWEILVPRFSNDGQEYPVEYHQRWDSRVREIAGGMTILRTAKGHWIDPDKKMFVEEMIPARIWCSQQNIEKIIDFTLSYYNQRAVFAYEISKNVLVRYRS